MLDILNTLNEKISGIVWGLPMIIAIISIGGYFTFKSGFFQITRFKLIFASTLGGMFKKRERGGVSPFKAMATALAGSAGTGNIIGVATAIAAGGPGAIFWMWASGLLGMMTKLAEVTLAVHFREKKGDGWRGGPMYYIKNGLGKKFAPLAAAFAVLCVLASFGVGNMTQVNAMSSSWQKSFNLSAVWIGIGMAAVVTLVIFGRMTKISSIAGFIVPFMSLFYIAGSLIVICVNIENLPGAVGSIFAGAFGIRQAGGGVIGFTMAQAVRFGVSRGVFTNEAGMGSSPIAHASAQTSHPAEQGMWGAMEVFLDTIVVCTVTALAILSSPEYLSGSITADWALTSAAFAGALGPFGEYFIAVSLALFSFATIIGWSYYGISCVEYLFKKHGAAASAVYRLIYVLCIIPGAAAAPEVLWTAADTLNGLMAVPNIIAVVLLSKYVFADLDDLLPKSVPFSKYKPKYGARFRC